METGINQTQDKKIDQKVSWTIFVWSIGIILVVGGIIVNYAIGANNKVDNAIRQVLEIKGDIKSINTSLIFIQDSLREIKGKIK